jgi:hypothetical protein
MSKYLAEMKEIYPNLSDIEIEEIIEWKIRFWKSIIENFDRFYDINTF